MAATYRPMHTFAVGDPATAGERVEVACDASLDEGSLIRCTFPPTPLSAGVEYFANVTPYQAEILIDLLQPPNDEVDPATDEISAFVEILRRIDDHRIYTDSGTSPDSPAILEGLEAHEPNSLFNEIPEGLEVTVTSGSSWAASVTLKGSRRSIIEFVRLHWGDDFSGNEAFPTWLEDIRDA